MVTALSLLRPLYPVRKVPPKTSGSHQLWSVVWSHISIVNQMKGGMQISLSVALNSFYLSGFGSPSGASRKLDHLPPRLRPIDKKNSLSQD